MLLPSLLMCILLLFFNFIQYNNVVHKGEESEI